jgi:hypothetical protein
MGLNKRATHAAVLLSAPIILFASFIELVAMLSGDRATKIDGYEIGDGLFLFFGYPLTRIINIFASPGGLQDGDTWWAVPFLNLLFLFQWIIWAQLIVSIGRLFQTLWRRRSKTTPSLQPVWPDYIIRADGRRYRLRTAPLRTTRLI